MKKLLLISALTASVVGLNAQSAAPQGEAAANAAAASVKSNDKSSIENYMTEAYTVFTENQANPKKRIPDEVLSEAYAVLMMRVSSGAIGIGASEGKGFATKNNIDNWSPPAFYSLASGSLGIQIGATRSDVILLFMNKKSADLLYEKKFQIGIGAVAEAGPVGGEASLNTWQDADILIYNTSKGLSVGVKISGGGLSYDQSMNNAVYGTEGITAKQILGSTVTMPDAADEFTNLLRDYSFVSMQPENAAAGE